MLELDECEAMSVVFLALQGNLLARHGYRLLQYHRGGQEKVINISLSAVTEYTLMLMQILTEICLKYVFHLVGFSMILLLFHI